MRNYSNSSKNASFPVIWESLTPARQRDLRALIVGATHASDATIFRWRKGETIPEAYSTRKDIAVVVSEFTGRQLTAEDLFPDK